MLSTFFIILSFTFIVFIIGFLLSFAAKKLKVEPKDPMQHMVEKAWLDARSLRLACVMTSFTE